MIIGRPKQSWGGSKYAKLKMQENPKSSRKAVVSETKARDMKCG